jgi:hypothetical protein
MMSRCTAHTASAPDRNGKKITTFVVAADFMNFSSLARTKNKAVLRRPADRRRVAICLLQVEETCFTKLVRAGLTSIWIFQEWGFCTRGCGISISMTLPVTSFGA